MSTTAQEPRTDGHQHDPHAGDGRGRGRQQRPSRHADGPGAGRVPVVDAAPALRSGRAALAESRSLRALLRPCVDAAVFADSSGRHSRRSTPNGKVTDEPSLSLDEIKQLPPMGQPHAGPSGVRPHDAASKPRPARSARVAATASAWRSPAAGSPPATTSPASSCSTSTSGRSAATAT